MAVIVEPAIAVEATINSDNVNQLTLAWIYRTHGQGIKATSLEVNGILYFTVPDNVYSHAWSVGDTVIWDNRGVLHRAAPYDPSSPREMLRTTVLGDEPIQ